MKITFLGGVQEITGSRYLIENEDEKVLIDCGLFQGENESARNNAQAFPIEPSGIDAVILTHAHIDHSGYIPALVKNGFKGKIYCSKPTYALCTILLVDSGFIQEEDAKKRKKSEDSQQSSEPLYTAQDAERALQFFQTVEYDKAIKIGASLTFTLIRSGHILGSSFILLSNGKKTISFSGDLGRPNQPVMKDPPYLESTDYLVIESTYGNRAHEESDPVKELGRVVNKTVDKKGVLIIPAFAIGRTQTILYFLYQLMQQDIIPKIPIFLDSPMAINATDLYCTFNDEHKLSPGMCTNVFDIATYTRSVQESKKIDMVKGSAIIIAGSGMANGGRVLEHFKHFISDNRNTVLFVGFQAKGTIGRALVEGTKEIEIHDKSYKVNADIEILNSLSAHADYKEILEWLAHFKNDPKKVFVTHGEEGSALFLKNKIEQRFGWMVIVPKYKESFELD